MSKVIDAVSGLVVEAIDGLSKSEGWKEDIIRNAYERLREDIEDPDPEADEPYITDKGNVRTKEKDKVEQEALQWREMLREYRQGKDTGAKTVEHCRGRVKAEGGPIDVVDPEPTRLERQLELMMGWVIPRPYDQGKIDRLRGR